MKILKWVSTAFIFTLLTQELSSAQTHFVFTGNTGNNATVGVPLTSNPNIDGNPLSNGDEIGAFTPEGLCVGGVVWNGVNTAITVWGDNDQTETVDGIKTGEQIEYRIWKKSTNVEYSNVPVNYSQGDGLYAADKILVLSSITASSSTDTVPHHFIFTSNTGNNATVGIPLSANPNIDGTPISNGDEIGAFTPAGLCVGGVVWNGANTAMTVWGDNDQTAAIDGIKSGEQLYYRVWKKSDSTEYSNVSTTYSQGDGIYAADKIFVLSSLAASTKTTTIPAKPTPLSPPSGATSQPKSVTLIGSSSPTATAYHLQLSADSTFAAVTINDSSITGTSRLVSGLSDSTTYSWRVSAKNSSGSSPYSAAFRFTTAGIVSGPIHFTFTNNTGNNATVGIPSSVNPNVDGVSLSSGDEIAAFTPQGLCVGAVVWNGTSAALTVWGDNDQTSAVDGIKAGELIHYRVWQKAINQEDTNVTVTYSQGDGIYGADKIFVLSSLTATLHTAAPVAPTLLSPSNGATQQPTGLTLSWISSTGATAYHLQFSADSTFSSTLINDSSIVDTSKQVSSLSNNTIYFWRVSAKNSIGSSRYSSFFRFTTVANGLVPTHFAFTSNTGNNATVGIPLSANPNVDGTPLSNGDEIGAFTPAGLCVGAIVWNTASAALTVWGDNDQTSTIDGIRAGEQIHYRIWEHVANREDSNVTATYSQGDGLYATDKVFVLSSLKGTLTAVQTTTPTPTSYSLFQNYPNPFNPSTMISYNLPKRAHVMLTVYDVLGREVRVVVNIVEQPGGYEVNFNASDLPSGVYFYRLTAGSFVATKKLLLLK